MLRAAYLSIIVLGFTPSLSYADTPPSPLEVDESIRTVLEDRGTDPIARSLYRQSPRQFLWISHGLPTAAARQVVANLADADADGLRPEDYRAAELADALGSTRDVAGRNVAMLARLDVDLTLALLRYVHDLHFGRINPNLVGFDLDVPRGPFDAPSLIMSIARGGDVSQALAAAAPKFYHYALLKAALAHYRRMAREGDVALAPLKRPIGKGDSYVDMPSLRNLLHRLGDLDDADIGGGNDLDEKALAALARFQSRHGLRSNGLLDSATFKALTTPLSARIQQIELTLERWRWIPEFSRPPIIVNIPQFRLFAFDSLEDRKADILQMDVIVGRTFPSAHTPVFMANMTSVIFRPYWQVPFGIVSKEIIPHAHRDPHYLASEQLEIVPANDEGSQALPVNSETLALLASGKLKLRQRPGPENALGLVKFSLPNPHDVYLHSTPTPALFQRPMRAFSHGCIRVSDPIALAVHVLRDTSTEWTAAAVSTAMRGDQTRHVNLTQPVPVLILYGTALATEDGEILFFNDLYGHDARLTSALAHSRAAHP
jgi:L,D-transpeptidase YcbB